MFILKSIHHEKLAELNEQIDHQRSRAAFWMHKFCWFDKHVQRLYDEISRLRNENEKLERDLKRALKNDTRDPVTGRYVKSD